MADAQEFQLIFERLRDILKEHEASLKLVENGETGYSLDTTLPYKGKAMFFGAVKQGKRYVSFHLMPVYACPDLLDGISPGLKKRMQGKSCFNFSHVDEALFSELSQMTQAGYARFREKGMA
ncbi:MAG: hypothetical protein IH586_19015 [Anaerolineaceae bacterium]|nr:hypothetical protein [Anaerolineaceae bacterium]